MDFTLNKYKKLLHTLIGAGYSFQTFAEFLINPDERSIILRHDVDKKPVNSLKFARIQKGLNIKGTYYFRTLPKLFDTNTILEISKAGHEIGYHYEDLNVTARKHLKLSDKNGLNAELIDESIERFKFNLAKMRNIIDVQTICMHGSPLSRLDGREIWKHYKYRDLEILGEPYFDIDFSEVLYLSDTGRSWNGSRYSFRDKLIPIKKPQKLNPTLVSEPWGTEMKKDNYMNISNIASQFQNRYQFRDTSDIIEAVKNNGFPDKAMFTFHPQRWTDKPLSWTIEFFSQNLKNTIKRLMIIGGLR